MPLTLNATSPITNPRTLAFVESLTVFADLQRTTLRVAYRVTKHRFTATIYFHLRNHGISRRSLFVTVVIFDKP